MARGRTTARARGRTPGTSGDWARARPDRLRAHGLGPLYYADRGLTLVSGVASALNDQAVTGYHLAQATGANRPTPAQFGGAPGLAFDATDALGRASVTMATGFGTLIVAARRDSVGTAADQWISYIDKIGIKFRSAGTDAWQCLDAAGVSSGVNLTTSAYVLGLTVRAGNDRDFWTNGSLAHIVTNAGVISAGSASLAPTAATTLGAVALFIPPLSTNMLVRVMKALAAKWRIPIAKA